VALASLADANCDAYLSRGLGRTPSGGGLMVVYSTQANDVAADGNATGRNSPFAAAFLKHIGTPNLDIREMLCRVQDEVSLKTDGHQIPEVSVPSAGGFKLKPEASATNPSERRSPPQDARQPTFDPRAMKLSLWESVRTSTNPAILQTYLDAYPSGRFAALAKAKIQELQKSQQPTPSQPPSVDPSAIELSYWESVRNSSSVASRLRARSSEQRGSVSVTACRRAAWTI
jgi:Caspase domain